MSATTPLADVADVKRILRFTDTDTDRDAQLQASLDVMQVVARRMLPKNLGRSGSLMEVWFDVPEDSTLRLPDSSAVVTMVKVFEYPSAYGVPLSPISLGLGHGYDQDDQGNLMLRPTLFVSPFEGASAVRRLRSYSRVEVNYIGDGAIPKDVTEGVAWMAAGYWKDGPRALQGLTSEKIGDYSYTLDNTGGTSSMPEWYTQAMFFLADYMKRRSRVTVT